jgi:periplasmic protein TonB
MTVASINPMRRSPVWEALLAALLVEAALVAVAVIFLERATPVPAPPPEPMKIELAVAPAPEAPRPPEPPTNTPDVPKPSTPTPPQTEPKPRVIRETTAAPTPAPILDKSVAEAPQEPAETPVDTPSAFATPPAQAAPPPPPLPPSASAASPTDLFQAALREAVQAAVRYPGAARMMKLVGQTRLGFDYLDGRITHPRVVRSSGRELLDQAALDALQRAAFPAPPKELAGHALNLEIVVVFSLQS